MTIWRPAYNNRSEAQMAVDMKPGLDVNAALDRATMSAAENIDGHMHRVFFPSDDTRSPSASGQCLRPTLRLGCLLLLEAKVLGEPTGQGTRPDAGAKRR
jgi:hypothetical protein